MKNPPGDKECFTVNLTVKADGTKLPAQVILKTAAKGGQLSDKYIQKLNVPTKIVVKSAPVDGGAVNLTMNLSRSCFRSGGRRRYLRATVSQFTRWREW